MSWKESHIYIHVSSLITITVVSFCRLVQSPSRTTLELKEVFFFVGNSHKSLASILNPWFSLLMCYLNTYRAILCVPIYAQGRGGQNPVLCTSVYREGTKQSWLHKDQAESCVSKHQKKVGFKTYFVAVSPF